MFQMPISRKEEGQPLQAQEKVQHWPYQTTQHVQVKVQKQEKITWTHHKKGMNIFGFVIANTRSKTKDPKVGRNSALTLLSAKRRKNRKSGCKCLILHITHGNICRTMHITSACDLFKIMEMGGKIDLFWSVMSRNIFLKSSNLNFPLKIET